MVVWLGDHKKRERPCDGNLLIVLWLITLETQILLSALGVDCFGEILLCSFESEVTGKL